MSVPESPISCCSYVPGSGFFFFPWSNGMHFLYPIRYWFLSNVPITILKNFSSLLFFLLLSLQSSLGHDRSHSRVKQIGIHTPTQPPRDLGQATYYSEPQFSYLHNGDTMSLRLGGSLLFQSSLLLFISITSPPTPTPSYRSFTCLHSWLCLFFLFQFYLITICHVTLIFYWKERELGTPRPPSPSFGTGSWTASKIVILVTTEDKWGLQSLKCT